MRHSRLWTAVAIALGLAITTGNAPQAAQGGGGGNKPPVEFSNNLSYPAIFTTTAVTLNGTAGTWTLDGVFPSSKSYGCNKPEIIGTSEYPNTSCVSSTGVPMTYDACGAGPCAGFTVDAIYRQKSIDNDWQARTLGPNLRPQFVDYLDWGDNLESATWKTTSVIRVEVTPFAMLPEPQTLMGFQMWHVYGQGPDELWGVRGNGPEDATPYVYDSPYAILHTNAARLNIAKLQNGSAACPSGGYIAPPVVATTWMKGVVPGGWSGLYTLRDIPYTAELNIGGKFVYGYNWQLQRDGVPQDVGAAGWWRLTFYTENNAVVTADSIVFDIAAPTTPPTLPPAYVPVPIVARTGGLTPLSSEGPLYIPTVDTANNLTYIDICIVEGRSGGNKPPK